MTTVQEMRDDPTREYLGDSVYARFRSDDGALILCTCNGLEVTNEIVLELPILEALAKYMERQRKQLERAMAASALIPPTDGDYTP